MKVSFHAALTIILLLSIFAVPFVSDSASAENLVIRMHLVTQRGIGKEIGVVTVRDERFGLILEPALTQLPPGAHGFHIHENPDCSPAVKDGKRVAAEAAGGHYDPKKTGRHEGPYGLGHLGDLPVLNVGNDGKAAVPLLAPRLKVSDVKGRALMIHAGADNYSDHPQKLGGGAGRIACGAAVAGR